MCDYHSQMQMRVLKQRGVENLPDVIKPVNGRAGIKTRADWHRVQVLKTYPKTESRNEWINEYLGMIKHASVRPLNYVDYIIMKEIHV